MKRRLSDDVVETFPTCFELWNNLTNEIKGLVIQQMDVKTRAVFKRCGQNESELVRRLGRNVVNLCVQYEKAENCNVGNFIIKLEDAKSNNLQLEWAISEDPENNATKVLYSGYEGQPLFFDEKSVEATLSMILVRLITEPMFVVKKLELKLGKFTKMINLYPIATSTNIELLILNGCENSNLEFSILRNMNLKFHTIVGITESDRRILYNFEYLTHRGPRIFPPKALFHKRMPHICSILFDLEKIESRMDSLGHLYFFWRLTFGRATFINEADVIKKLELPKTITDIMCFRAAYYYKSCPVKSLQSAKNYEKRMIFLRDGIDGYLSDYQLTNLTVVYLVRLFRNEPEILRVQNTALKDLELAVEKYEHLNWYRKLVTKIVFLLP